MKRGFRSLITFTATMVSAVLLCAAGVHADTNQFDAPSGITFDLYKVMVQSHDDADALSAAKADVLLRVQDGYLVLAGSDAVESLTRSELKFEMIASGVDRNHLALDIRLDKSNVGKFPLIYEEDGLRLFGVEPSDVSGAVGASGLSPILTENLRVVHREPRSALKATLSAEVNLDSLIDLIEQDSLVSYLERLQAFRERSAGTDSNYASRDWIAGKLTDFGYDSVVIDSFTAVIGSSPTECQNVIAYKIGTTYPEFQVIVGAHRDAVPGSPGADDNGSGTVGVLEIARVLKDIDTRLTFVFVLFDAEEDGLLGAWHYANGAAARGDSIVCMLNMDMIGYLTNSTRALLYHGSDITYPQLWQHLADSLTDIGITGYLSGTSGGSDHYPFQQNGYDVVFCIEYDFSLVYHTYRDSTTYINYNYFRRMVQATLATGAAIDDSFTPAPWLAIDFPNGVPAVLAPMAEAKFDVTAQGLYGGTAVPGSGQLYYSIDGGSYSTVALSEVGGGLYEATIPDLNCSHSVEYYVSVDETTSGRVYAPDPATPLFAVVATELTAVFEDDFELSNGWTVSGDATDGQWQRGVPAGGGERGDPPTDFDGSGSCYLTDNLLGNSDVDAGTTYLFSPVIDLQGSDAVIGYARWYSNDFGNAPFSDVMEISISNNAGADWVLVETVGPVEQASGGWFENAFVVSDFVAPTDQMMMMFSASDLGDGSVVEAAVDAFSVAAITCFSYICGDADGSGGINLLDVTHIVNYLYREGPAPNPPEAGDANGDGGVNLLDVTHLVNYLYKEGPEPVCP